MIGIFAAWSESRCKGIAAQLRPRRDAVSAAIHEAVVDAPRYPTEKRAHRFFHLDREDFGYSPAPGRTDDYTIIEISLFECRSAEAKKKLIQLLYERLHAHAGRTLSTSRSRSPTPLATTGGCTGSPAMS